jgi:hypothetical protein
MDGWMGGVSYGDCGDSRVLTWRNGFFDYFIEKSWKIFSRIHVFQSSIYPIHLLIWIEIDG